MNGEQKGGVKNHFRTLFRIIKKKQLKTKKIEEEQKKLKEKEIKIQKNKVIDFGFNNDKKIINPPKRIKLNVNIPNISIPITGLYRLKNIIRPNTRSIPPIIATDLPKPTINLYIKSISESTVSTIPEISNIFFLCLD